LNTESLLAGRISSGWRPAFAMVRDGKQWAAPRDSSRMGRPKATCSRVYYAPKDEVALIFEPTSSPGQLTKIGEITSDLSIFDGLPTTPTFATMPPDIRHRRCAVARPTVHGPHQSFGPIVGSGQVATTTSELLHPDGSSPLRGKATECHARSSWRTSRLSRRYPHRPTSHPRRYLGHRGVPVHARLSK
jgi:hypothetical protein